MAYNDLNLGDTIVQGHKFVGGATVSLYSSTVPSTGATIDVTDDGFVQIYFLKTSADGALGIKLNGGIQLISYGFNFAGAQITGFPLKKGDKLNVSTDVGGAITLGVTLFKYR